jgi:hypothetical protein
MEGLVGRRAVARLEGLVGRQATVGLEGLVGRQAGGATHAPRRRLRPGGMELAPGKAYQA